MILHDEDQEANYPVRSYRCTSCGTLHVYKRAFIEIPRRRSPCCDVPMCRDYGEDGVRFQIKTEVRDVRHKLRQEEREGKRPRAIEETPHHIATL